METYLETDTQLNSLQHINKESFEVHYKRMALPLLNYVNKRIRDKTISEEIVQEIFVSLWSRRCTVNLRSVEHYLYASAKYQMLNHIRSKGVRQKYIEHFSLYLSQVEEDSIEEMMYLADLKSIVEEHIKKLPPKCQLVFRRSRFEYKSIAEIAQEMNISPRTVENHMTKALKHLRNELVHYPLIFILILANLL